MSWETLWKAVLGVVAGFGGISGIFVIAIKFSSNFIAEKLSKKYEVYICSAYLDKRVPEKSGVVTNTKHMWLYKNLPFLDPKNFIFTSRKDLIDCDIKIDDKVGNLKGHGKLKLLVDSYHNQKYTAKELKKLGITRVRDWTEIENILL